MSKFGIFFLLFCDSFFGNLLLYPHKEYIIFAIKYLNTANPLNIFFIGVLGFILSVVINYFCGFIAKKIYISSMKKSKMHNYHTLLNSFQKYGWIILLFNILPLFGKFLPFLAGFVSFGLIRTVIFCSISKIIYYSYIILL